MDDDPLLGFGLHPVRMTDQATFERYFNSLENPLSDYTFAQVFTWGNSLRILWREIQGHLCVFANGTGDLTLLMPPIGDGDAGRALSEAFEIMDEYNRAHDAVGRSRVEYVSDELLARMDRSRLVLAPMGADYVYDVRRMIDLAGGDLASKRQLKNRFLRNYDCRVETYDPARHHDACVALLRQWKQRQDSSRSADGATSALKRRKESLACELALDNAQALRLAGEVVHVRPKTADAAQAGAAGWALGGFTFGEALGTDQSSIIIEKTNLEVRGLAQFIFSDFCQRCWADRRLVNAGDDWGLETLAWTKMSYRPVLMLQKYEVRLADRIAVAVKPSRGDSIERPAEALAPTVRYARADDMEAAVKLEASCFSTHCLTKRRLRYLRSRPSAVFLVAEDKGRLVAQGISLVRRHKRVCSGRIYSLAVAGEYRGRRIGQQLLRAMIEDLAGRGVRRIYLEVEETNATAIRLYQRNGFRRVGTLSDYYGSGRPGVHMVCDVPAPAAPARRPGA